MAAHKFVYHLILENRLRIRPCHGWQVRVRRMLGGKQYDVSRYYAFKKHGGKHAALRKALRWRNRNIPLEWM